MSSNAPPIPPEQVSDKGPAQQAHTTGTQETRPSRDDVTHVDDGQPGDAGVNTDQQGRYGGIKQNTTHQGLQQDR